MNQSVKRSDKTRSNPKEKKQDKRKALTIAGVIAAFTILIFGVATGIFFHYYSLMDTSKLYNYTYQVYTSYSDEDSNVELPEDEVISDKDVVNILLVGTDERSAEFDYSSRADTIMIISLNNKSGEIKLISLERGMTVRILGRKDDLLTNTFRYGGPDLLINTVCTHLSVDVDKYVRINMQVFQKLIDEIGGIDINLTEEEAYGLNTKNFNTWELDREVSVGINHLNGYEALQYARLRWIDDDAHRVERQRNVIDAVKQKMGDISIIKLADVAEKCLPYVQTNLSSLDFAKLIISIPNFLESDLEQMTVPKSGTYANLKNVNFKANSKAVREFLYE